MAFKIRLLLRSVYLKGQVDANRKIADMSWEDEIVKEIEKYYGSLLNDLPELKAILKRSE